MAAMPLVIAQITATSPFGILLKRMAYRVTRRGQPFSRPIAALVPARPIVSSKLP